MRFANPTVLNLLWLIPLVAWALHLLYYYRRKVSARFVEAHLLDEVAKELSLKRARLKAVLLMVAIVLMIVAMARPQWGYKMQNIKRQGLDMMVSIDVSKSMLTQDVKPSRLDRTKLAVKDLVKKLKGDRIGLIAFAGQSFVMCPLTTDYNGFMMSLDDLGVDSIPRGGTDLGLAIEEAMKGYGDSSQTYKTVILVTDGEEGEGDALSAARKAKGKGIKIYTVGVGTKEGGLIQVPDENGQLGFLKDAQGNFVKSRLNENLLQQIAYTTGASYVRGGGAQFGLDYLYEQQLSKLEKRDIDEKQDKKYHERYQWPLTVAFLCLLFDALLITRKPRHYDPPKAEKQSKFSWLSVFFVASFFYITPAFASSAGEVREGNRLFHESKFDESIKWYEKALDAKKLLPVVDYDLGAAYYKKDDFEKAQDYWQKAMSTEDMLLKSKAQYNLGNALYKSGLSKENANLHEAISDLEKAVANYEQVIVQGDKDADASFNNDIAKKQLERLKKKQQEQQQKQQQDKEQQRKDQQDKEQNKQQDQQQNQQQEKKRGEQSPEDKQKSQEQEQQEQQQQGQQEEQKESEENDPQQQQAQAILEDYERNEQPKSLMQFVTKPSNEKPVNKDW